MAVTEFAILRLQSANTQPPASVLSGLKRAKSAMEISSGYPFNYFRCIDDPNIIYILGAWPSIDYHMNVWIPSKENQDLLELLDGELSVDAMFHVDIDRDITPIPAGANVLAVGRHFVTEGGKDGFERAFEAGRKYLEEFAGERNVAWGWRVDKETEDKEEFVLFTGWESVERHLEFAKTEGFQEYLKIKEFVREVDVKHAKLLDVEGDA